MGDRRETRLRPWRLGLTAAALAEWALTLEAGERPDAAGEVNATVGRTPMTRTGGRTRTLREPMVLVGSHEPLSFRRRTGYAAANEVETWEREHAEDTVQALADRGVTWVRAHFFKGNGLKWERPEIELTRKFAETCHKHGIRVELSTQFGTLQYETLLDEVPEMARWVSIDESGQPIRIRYGHQDFRYKPCATREGFWAYLREVIRVGIQEVKGDGFGFDNIELPDEPESCHCPECRKAFVEFRKRKYTLDTPAGRAAATKRFGFPVLDHVRPPVFNRFNPVATCRFFQNPVFQEWAEFKCESLRKRFEEVWRFAKALKPDIMLEYNVYPPFGKNAAFYQGIEMHRLGPYMDMFYNERGPYLPECRPDGVLWHRVHAYKLAEALGCEGVVTGKGGRHAEQQRLSFAESLAFNQGQITGMGGILRAAEGGNPEADAFIAFCKRNADLFEGAVSAAEVGLFESSVSLRLNSVQPYIAEILAMAGLLSGRVPWALVTDLADETLARYRVLILPDSECLSEEEGRRLIRYVEQGGGLVITERTGFYDHGLRWRPESVLAPILKTARGYDKMTAALAGRGGVSGAVTLRGAIGRGRFVHLARLEPVKPFRDFAHNVDGPNIGVDEWHVPANARAFLDAIAEVSADRLTIEVRGPKGLAAEVRATPDSRRLVHLVNYVLNKPAGRVTIRARGPVRSARLVTPWEAKPKALRVGMSAGVAVVSVGTVGRYAVVDIQ